MLFGQLPLFSCPRTSWCAGAFFTRSRVYAHGRTDVIFAENNPGMKYLYGALLLFVTAVPAMGQNEFSGTAFANAFKKLYANGPNGFAAYKGQKLRSMGSFFNVHTCRELLPGADSGIVSVPTAIGNPSATQYFKTSATLAAARQREAALSAAVKNAAGKTLFEKKVTDTIGKFVFYRTRLYNTAAATVFDLELETYVVLDRGRYYTALVVYGKTPPPTPTGKSKLSAEPDLQGRINGLMAAMQTYFAAEKGAQKETTEYYTTFETVSRLYGQTGTLKERKFETSITFALNSQQLDGPAEAQQIYEKLKAAFAATGRFTMKPETKEGTRTWMFASETVTGFKTASFTLVLEYYADAYNPSVSFLMTKKRL
jgi:hypothetical protein